MKNLLYMRHPVLRKTDDNGSNWTAESITIPIWGISPADQLVVDSDDFSLLLISMIVLPSVLRPFSTLLFQYFALLVSPIAYMFEKFGKVPFALLCLIAGAILTVVGTIAFLMNYAALNMAGFFYGIPLFLGGIAFYITELKPVPLTQPTTPAVVAQRSRQATATQQQILNDLTRYRYGQKAHLDSALKFLGLSPTDEERPEIVGLYETLLDDAYTLVLGFESPMIPFETWQKKHDKMTAFFGPGVKVLLEHPEEDLIKVSIVATDALPDATTGEVPANPALVSS